MGNSIRTQEVFSFVGFGSSVGVHNELHRRWPNGHSTWNVIGLLFFVLLFCLRILSGGFPSPPPLLDPFLCLLLPF